MDHIPNRKPNRDSEIDQQMRLRDLQERARAARPVDTGRDILKLQGRFGEPFESI